MENPFNSIQEAVEQARTLERAVHWQSNSLAYLLAGNLRHVDSRSTLARLKRELQDYNSHTSKWKD